MTVSTYNITDIWKQKSNIGYTEYVNIADGTTKIVYWGQLEWIGALISCSFTIGAAAILLKLMKVF